MARHARHLPALETADPWRALPLRLRRHRRDSKSLHQRHKPLLPTRQLRLPAHAKPNQQSRPLTVAPQEH